MACGSGGDFAARLIAQGVSPALGQQIIVELPVKSVRELMQSSWPGSYPRITRT